MKKIQIAAIGATVALAGAAPFLVFAILMSCDRTEAATSGAHDMTCTPVTIGDTRAQRCESDEALCFGHLIAGAQASDFVNFSCIRKP